MEANNRVYERLDTQRSDRSESNNIPQGIPSQYPQFAHPQYQLPGYLHHPQMTVMPYQSAQQSAPQSNGTLPQLPPALQMQPLNPLHLKTLTEGYEQEIQKHKKMVTINYILVVLQALAFFFGVIFLTGALSMLDELCDTPDYLGFDITDFGYDESECAQFFDDLGAMICFVAIPVLMVVFCVLVNIHKKAIVAYNKRQADSMESSMICFGILFFFSLITFNFIGLAIYGYLTYAACQVKNALKEIKRIEDFQANESLSSLPNHQLNQTNHGDFHAVI